METATRRSPITALLGPRQVGKTTLARLFTANRPASFFDLESLPDQRRLQNPEMVLGSLQGLVILDEIQQMPELFSTLRVLVDRPENQARFIILGSASPHLIRRASESLAGRVEFIELSGFDLSETDRAAKEKLWLRGGFPRAFLADKDADSLAWREGFIRTFLERDLPQLGISIPSTAMRRFWSMLAHYHGQTWNASELSRAMGLSDKTVRSYLDILSGAFMVRQLQPWFENASKRQVRAPEIYIRDSGLLHSLLNIPDMHTLLGHPKVGASWEGYVIEQTLSILHPTEAYFWAKHGAAELDLLFFAHGKRYGIEAKFNEAPKVTRSMQAALQELGLEHLWVIYPGERSYPVYEQITVCPLSDLIQLVEAI
ncbi:MAG: ATP-binding protein [Anaerolineales bacterium]|nr:ATP-binding protein [Anaerolineales bacterium]